MAKAVEICTPEVIEEALGEKSVLLFSTAASPCGAHTRHLLRATLSARDLAGNHLFAVAQDR